MQIVKNFLYNLSYQILVLILPLITVPYVSNILGAEGVGDYAFTFANTQYFVIFGMVGISLYASRQIAYVRDDKVKLKENFYSIYLIQFITTTISLITFIVFIIAFNTGYYRSLYMIQGINILAAVLDISWLFIGLEQFKKTVIRNTIVKIASLCSIFIFVKSINDISIYVLILALSNLIGNITFWAYIPQIIGFDSIKVSRIKEHFMVSISLFIPQIAIQIYVLLSRTLLGIFTSNVEVGYYENSQKIVKIALTIATAIGTVMMPKIANTVAIGDMKKVKYYIKNSFFFMSFISIPLTFGLMGIANEFSPWFFGKNFEGIETLIVISSLIIIAISWSNVLGTQLLIPLNKTKEFTISVTVGAVINLTLNLILLKNMESIGACITTVIAELSVTAIQFYFTRNIINPFELIKSILIFLPSAIAMYLIVRFIGIQLGTNIFTTILQVTIGGLIYSIGTGISFKIVYKQNIIAYIKNMIK